MTEEIVQPQSLDISTKEKLKGFIKIIERIEAQEDDVKAQKADVYADAKSQGFDTKALRKVIARRKKDARKVQEEETMIDLYLHAVGEI